MLLLGWRLPGSIWPGHAAARRAAASRLASSERNRYPWAHWPQPLASSTPTKASFIRSSSRAKAQLPSLLVRLTGVLAVLQSGVAARGSQATVALPPVALPSSLPEAAVAAGPLGGRGETPDTASCAF